MNFFSTRTTLSISLIVLAFSCLFVALLGYWPMGFLAMICAISAFANQWLD